MVFQKKLVLVDGHALLHRAFHALPDMRGPEGFPTGAIFGFLSMLFKAIADIKPTHVLVTFDVPGPTFRDQLAADYKATRKPTPEDLSRQLPRIKEILAALEIPVYEQVGYEADDLLGIISHQTPQDVLNIIVTGDLDMLQLIDNHTHVYRFKIGFSDIQIFNRDKMVEVYGLTPEQWVDYKAIKGDTSDNIPGVPGIGEKGGLELVKTFGGLGGIYEAVEKKDSRIKAGTLKKLVAGKDKAYLSYKLAHIDRKNHLDFDFEKTTLGDYDRKTALKLLHELEIKALDGRLPKASGYTQESRQEAVNSKQRTPGGKIIRTKEEAIIAAYLLNPGLREYLADDWDGLEKELAGKNLMKIFQEIERPLVPILDKMEKRGIRIDVKWLKELSRKLAQRIGELTKEIHEQAGEEFNIASPIQLREILFDKLRIPADNIKKTGKTKALSTGAEQLEKLRGLHPIVDLIFEYREITKLKSTYVDALPQLVGSDGRLHTKYSQTIAATGRLSSSEPNLQNIPIRSDLGNEVRRAFVAEEGYALLSLDYSQIELRIAASLSGDQEMIAIFKSGGDFHTATAARIFGVKESEVTPSQRRDAKTVNFSILYGVSAFGLSERSEMERGEAAEYIKKYYEAFPQLKAYLNGLIQLAHQDGFMKNPLNRIRYFPDINASNWAVRTSSERAAVNMPIQSLAADIMKLSMIEIDKEFPELKMLLSVHDELLFEVRADEEKIWATKLAPIMESVYKLSAGGGPASGGNVPIVVDAKSGPNWAEMETI